VTEHSRVDAAEYGMMRSRREQLMEVFEILGESKTGLVDKAMLKELPWKMPGPNDGGDMYGFEEFESYWEARLGHFNDERFQKGLKTWKVAADQVKEKKRMIFEGDDSGVDTNYTCDDLGDESGGIEALKSHGLSLEEAKIQDAGEKKSSPRRSSCPADMRPPTPPAAEAAVLSRWEAKRKGKLKMVFDALDFNMSGLVPGVSLSVAPWKMPPPPEKSESYTAESFMLHWKGTKLALMVDAEFQKATDKMLLTAEKETEKRSKMDEMVTSDDRFNGCYANALKSNSPELTSIEGPSIEGEKGVPSISGLGLGSVNTPTSRFSSFCSEVGCLDPKTSNEELERWQSKAEDRGKGARRGSAESSSYMSGDNLSDETGDDDLRDSSASPHTKTFGRFEVKGVRSSPAAGEGGEGGDASSSKRSSSEESGASEPRSHGTGGSEKRKSEKRGRFEVISVDEAPTEATSVASTGAAGDREDGEASSDLTRNTSGERIGRFKIKDADSEPGPQAPPPPPVASTEGVDAEAKGRFGRFEVTSIDTQTKLLAEGGSHSTPHSAGSAASSFTGEKALSDGPSGSGSTLTVPPLDGLPIIERQKTIEKRGRFEVKDAAEEKKKERIGRFEVSDSTPTSLNNPTTTPAAAVVNPEAAAVQAVQKTVGRFMVKEAGGASTGGAPPPVTGGAPPGGGVASVPPPAGGAPPPMPERTERRGRFEVKDVSEEPSSPGSEAGAGMSLSRSSSHSTLVTDSEKSSSYANLEELVQPKEPGSLAGSEPNSRPGSQPPTPRGGKRLEKRTRQFSVTSLEGLANSANNPPAPGVASVPATLPASVTPVGQAMGGKGAEVAEVAGPPSDSGSSEGTQPTSGKKVGRFIVSEQPLAGPASGAGNPATAAAGGTGGTPGVNFEAHFSMMSKKAEDMHGMLAQLLANQAQTQDVNAVSPGASSGVQGTMSTLQAQVEQLMRQNGELERQNKSLLAENEALKAGNVFNVNNAPRPRPIPPPGISTAVIPPVPPAPSPTMVTPTATTTLPPSPTPSPPDTATQAVPLAGVTPITRGGAPTGANPKAPLPRPAHAPFQSEGGSMGTSPHDLTISKEGNQHEQTHHPSSPPINVSVTTAGTPPPPAGTGLHVAVSPGDPVSLKVTTNIDNSKPPTSP